MILYPQNDSIAFYNQPWRLVANAVLLLVMTAFCALTGLGLRDQSWAFRAVGVSIALLFAAGVIWSVYTLFRRAPAILLNEQGVTCDAGFFPLKPIPWSEVVGARSPGRSWFIRGNVLWTPRAIVLDVRDTARARRWSRWRYSRISGGFLVPIANLGIPAEDVAGAINRYIAQHKPER